MTLPSAPRFLKRPRLSAPAHRCWGGSSSRKGSSRASWQREESKLARDSSSPPAPPPSASAPEAVSLHRKTRGGCEGRQNFSAFPPFSSSFSSLLLSSCFPFSFLRLILFSPSFLSFLLCLVLFLAPRKQGNGKEEKEERRNNCRGSSVGQPTSRL